MKRQIVEKIQKPSLSKPTKEWRPKNLHSQVNSQDWTWFPQKYQIEAMAFLYFVALMIVSLMERNIRKNMAEEKVEKLQILPSRMNTKRPTWNNLNYFFRNIPLSLIEKNGRTIQTIMSGVTNLHETVLQLLGVSVSAYTKIQDQWWLFKNPAFAQNFDSI